MCNNVYQYTLEDYRHAPSLSSVRSVHRLSRSTHPSRQTQTKGSHLFSRWHVLLTWPTRIRRTGFLRCFKVAPPRTHLQASANAHEMIPCVVFGSCCCSYQRGRQQYGFSCYPPTDHAPWSHAFTIRLALSCDVKQKRLAFRGTVHCAQCQYVTSSNRPTVGDSVMAAPN